MSAIPNGNEKCKRGEETPSDEFSAQLPAELTTSPQWVCWRYETGASRPKPAKVPYNPCTGQRASVTNAARGEL
jgi:primase-polymerase (primpol)-like protein